MLIIPGVLVYIFKQLKICEIGSVKKEKKKSWDALSGEEKAEEKNVFVALPKHSKSVLMQIPPTWKFILSEAVLEIRFSLWSCFWK